MKIVLIVLDAVRQDHIDVYAEQNNLTPTLNALAERGLVFTDCISGAPWTPPSHATIFTGQYPSSHNVRADNLCFHSDNHYFPKQLSEMGVTTEAFGAGTWLSRRQNFDLMFDRFLDPENHRWSDYLYIRGGVVAGLKYLFHLLYSSVAVEPNIGDGNFSIAYIFPEWISGNNSFSFVNIKAAHSRYFPPKTFRDQVGVSQISDDYFLTEQPLYRYMAGEVSPSEDQWKTLRSLYAGSVLHADYLLGKIVNQLDDDTWIIVTSDHGEHLGEFQRAGHQFSLRDELIRVPLIISHPSLDPSRQDLLVSHIDIASTIYSIAEKEGYQIPNSVIDDLPGEDLLTLSNNNDRVVFSEYGPPAVATNAMINRCQETDEQKIYDEFFRGMRAAITSEYKYIEYFDGQQYLFERTNENSDLSDKYPKKVDFFETKVDEVLKESRDVDSSEIDSYVDDEIKDQLEELGYL